MPLAPETRSLLDMMYRVGAPRFHELSVEQARRSFQKLCFAFRPEAPAVGSVTEVPIPRPGGQGAALMARFYRPAELPPEAQLPLLIYYHGGGWCVGDVSSYDVLCRELCNQGACAVLSVDYRLAPEHPFPAAVDDAWLAFQWAEAQAELLGIDPARIALGGDSAGGNLSIVTALQARQRGGPRPAWLMLVYPSTDMAGEARPSRTAWGHGYGLDRESLVWFAERYLPHGGLEDWRVSPLRAASLAGLPPMWLLTAECDPLIDECVAFRDAVRAAGGSVEHLPVDGVIHGFFTLGKFFPQAREAVAAAARALRRALAGAG